MRGTAKLVFWGIFLLNCTQSTEILARDACITNILKMVRANSTQLEPISRVWSRTDVNLFWSGPCPLGMTALQFAHLLAHFTRHKSLEDADVIVLYGSRLHLEAGYLPRADSDLDFTIFYKMPPGQEIIPDAFEKDILVNQSLSSLGLDFPMKIDVPRYDGFASFLRKEAVTDLKREREAHRLLDALAEDGDWDPATRRLLYHDIRNKNWFNPEAIFIFRSTRRIQQRIKLLRALGYKNFILL